MYPRCGVLRYALSLLCILLMHALTISGTHTLRGGNRGGAEGVVGGPESVVGERRGMDFEALRRAIDDIQLVDAHAHNLVDINSTLPFIHAFSLARGDDVAFSNYTLSFNRNVRYLTLLYGSKAASSLQGIEEYRRASGLQSIASTCFQAARISAILIDDGLEMDKMQGLEWHKNFTSFVGRVLRIERLAENLLDQGLPDGSPWTMDSFTAAFSSNLNSVAGQIYSLKSVVSYYSGLKINTNVTKMEAEEGLRQVLSAGKPTILRNKNLVDYIFMLSLEFAQLHDLPMQIHSGIGEGGFGLNLRLANPLYLYDVLEDKRFSKCRIVLLHASYPFSKEASYLASVYSQVYLDFGLVIPKLSTHGMISSVKDLLDLAPLNKVMFSTDAYAFPELFYLGAMNAREVVFIVLRDAYSGGQLTGPQAVEAAKDLFARNAINFYKIKI